MDGSLAGRYRIQRELARGGFGVVYAGIDTVLDCPVAIKRLQVQLSPDDLIRFRREALAVAQLQHPNIVGVREVGQEHGQWFMVMELVEGPSLQERLKFTGPWDEVDAAQFVAQIAEAIEHAHRAGVLHRDLKPANVLITPDGQPKVVDFGLAKIRDLRGRVGDVPTGGLAESLTVDGEILGTPDYMPPEQALGQTVDGRADVYALGGTLFALLTGQAPRSGSTALGILTRLLEDPTPSPSALRPDLDPELEAICLRAMAKEPHERFPDMRVFAWALHAWVRGRRSGRRRAALFEGHTLTLIAVTGLAIGGGLGVLLARKGDRSVEPADATGSPRRTPAQVAVISSEVGASPAPTPRPSKALAGQEARYQALIEQAREEARVGDTRGALKALGEAIRLQPDHALAYVVRGLLWRRLGAHPKALDDYGRALKCPRALGENVANVSRPEIYLQRMELYVSLRQPKLAMADCNAGLRIAPQHYVLLSKRGFLHTALMQLPRAKADFEAACQIDPQRPAAWVGLGNLAFGAGRHEEAERLYGRALSADPRNFEGLLRRGAARRRLQDWKGSLQDLDLVVRLHPRDSYARRERGRTLERAGRLREAGKEYALSLELAPQQKGAASLRGKVRRFLGRDVRPAAKLNERRAPE